MIERGRVGHLSSKPYRMNRRQSPGAPGTPARPAKPGSVPFIPGAITTMPVHRSVQVPLGRPRAARVAMPGLEAWNMAGLDPTVDGMGFSLKPPKWARKAGSAVFHSIAVNAKQLKKDTTLKNVLKAGAVVGGVLLAPVVLPALAAGAATVGGAALSAAEAGAGLIAKGVVGAGKLVGKGAAGIFGSLIPSAGDKNNPDGGGIIDPRMLATIDPINSGTTATPTLPGVPAGTAPPTATDASGSSPALPTGYSSGGGSGSGGSTATPDETSISTPPTKPETAGVGGGGMVMLALGGLALLALTSRKRLRR